MSAWTLPCSGSLRTSQNSLVCDGDHLFDFPSPVNHLLSKLTKVILHHSLLHFPFSVRNILLLFIAGHTRSLGTCLTLFLSLRQHMRSPSVSCLDVDTSPPTSDSTPATLTPSTPAKSHRRSASCGNNPGGNSQSSGSDMHIIRIRMDLQDGNLYRSILVRRRGHVCRRHIIPSHACLSQSHRNACSALLPQVTSNDKTPTVISSALEKHNQDPKHTSRYELIQLLPEGKGETGGEPKPSDQHFSSDLLHFVRWEKPEKCFQMCQPWAGQWAPSSILAVTCLCIFSPIFASLWYS